MGTWEWIPGIDDVERPADDDSPGFHGIPMGLGPGGLVVKRPVPQSQGRALAGPTGGGWGYGYG